MTDYDAALSALERAISTYVTDTEPGGIVIGFRACVAVLRPEDDDTTLLIHLAPPGQPWHVSVGLATAEADHVRATPRDRPSDE